LAVIGGGSSDRARALALALRESGQRTGGEPPLLLITTATVDEVTLPDSNGEVVPFHSVHADRTFRFCFTNRQMAEAVTDFLWTQDELRPDADAAYVVSWEDDPYSVDLAERFRRVAWQRREVARDAGSAAAPFWSIRVPHSVGPFSQPNRKEAEAARKLMDELSQHPQQRRPWLVLPATAQPARRFLRALMALAPAEAARFVVTSGDSIDFNTLYRDRTLTWPIQELPFALVLFFHRNPVDAGWFQPGAPTSTEDVLLYGDIVTAAAGAAFDGADLVNRPGRLAERLHKDPAGRFDADGNRPSGLGEFVVCLLPVRDRDRLKPQARLQVWRTGPGQPARWALVRELSLDYTQRGFVGE
jgi:hypothetical protein